jgi:hypothetical protein
MKAQHNFILNLQKANTILKEKLKSREEMINSSRVNQSESRSMHDRHGGHGDQVHPDEDYDLIPTGKIGGRTQKWN